MSAGRSWRLIQVLAPGVRGDFAVTADSTFAEVAPLFAQHLGIDLPPDGVLWVALDGRVLDPGASPASAGVVDGDQLDLSADPLSLARQQERLDPRPEDARRRRFGSAAC